MQLPSATQVVTSYGLDFHHPDKATSRSHSSSGSSRGSSVQHAPKPADGWMVGTRPTMTTLGTLWMSHNTSPGQSIHHPLQSWPGHRSGPSGNPEWLRIPGYPDADAPRYDSAGMAWPWSRHGTQI